MWLYQLDKQGEKTDDRAGSETANILGATPTIDIRKWKRSKQTTLEIAGKTG